MRFRKPRSPLTKLGFNQKDQYAAKKEGWTITFKPSREGHRDHHALANGTLICYIV